MKSLSVWFGHHARMNLKKLTHRTFGSVSSLRAACLASLLAVSCAAGAVDVPAMNPGLDSRLSAARLAIADRAWGRAIMELQIVVRDDPGNADAHNLLGYALRKSGPAQLQRALEHYRTALRIDPHHRGAHEYIGEAYLMLGDTDSARRHLQDLERICGGTACEEYQDLAAALKRAR